jgi:hypothetical protein
LKKILILTLILIGKQSIESFSQSSQSVGADKDDHGCIGSAGYQWSILKKECIRPFELKIQLSNSDKTFNCGIVLSKNQGQAELFCKEGHFIFVKNGKNQIYLQVKTHWSMYKKQGKWKIDNAKGKTIYQ